MLQVSKKKFSSQFLIAVLLAELEHDIGKFLIVRFAFIFANRIGNAGFQVIPYYLFGYAPKRLLDGGDLCKYIDTVAFVFYQLRHASELAFDNVKAPQCLRFVCWF